MGYPEVTVELHKAGINHAVYAVIRDLAGRILHETTERPFEAAAQEDADDWATANKRTIVRFYVVPGLGWYGPGERVSAIRDFATAAAAHAFIGRRRGLRVVRSGWAVVDWLGHDLDRCASV